MTHKREIKSLVRKFVANRASEEEIELLQEYFKTPLGLKYLAEIIDEHAADFDKSSLMQFSSKLPSPLGIKDEDNNRSLRFSSTMIRAIAATFIGLAMVVGVYIFQMATVYKTVAGQKKTITLPDNTVVTLNGNSSLSFYGDWSDSRLRSVDLSGEAYFEVTSHAQNPFVVNTSGISIEVLGTTFNVKSYDEDKRVETTLVEGKVLIEKTTKGNAVHESIELSPDQKATFNKDSKQITLEEVNPESEAAWIRGSLVFEDEPFAEIIKDLERLYGVKIFVKDKSALQCRFSTRIEGESLEEILKLFSLSEDVKYRIHDHEAWIDESLCDQKSN